MIDQLSDLELLRLKALEQYHWDEWMPEYHDSWLKDKLKEIQDLLD